MVQHQRADEDGGRVSSNHGSKSVLMGSNGSLSRLLCLVEREGMSQQSLERVKETATKIQIKDQDSTVLSYC